MIGSKDNSQLKMVKIMNDPENADFAAVYNKE